MVSGIPSNPSAQLLPVLDWIIGCEEISLDRFNGALSDVDYEHLIVPASLNIPPSRSKQAWLDWFSGGWVKLFDVGMVTLSLHEVFEAPGHVTAHFSSRGTTKRGDAFANEYLTVFQVRQDTPGGPYKIWRVKEFVDSAVVAHIRSQLPHAH
ncbi:hypothetical protein AURDEDRAFT_126986 [Auricularia subglabra TFB-10046 SS5]|nr:hypothetical protein AURDEDRAFT_126986 [Auricularia subglabra TFB-10046 SS5]